MKAIPTHRTWHGSPVGQGGRVLPFASFLALGFATLAVTGCTGGVKGDPDNRGDFKVVSISTGTGSVYPYRIRTTDQFGNPTSTVVNIESEAILKANVSGSNGVLPVVSTPKNTSSDCTSVEKVRGLVWGLIL